MPPVAPPNGEHVPVVFNGGLPGPEGDVASSCGTTPTADQKQQAIDLYEFLKNVDVQPLELNADLIARTAIINIPRSSKVRLVYGGGFGASTIGTTGPLDGKFLFLHGEGGANVGPPTPMVFPTLHRYAKRYEMHDTCTIYSKYRSKLYMASTPCHCG